MVMTTKRTKKEKYTCECGGGVTKGYEFQHTKGNKHQGWLSPVLAPLDAPVISLNGALDPDLQAIVDSADRPILRAKMTRAAFGARNWPNPSHPGTVVDFLKEHGIPFLNTADGASATDQKLIQANWEKEVIYGRLNDQA
jgi:hypothetical protein